MSMQMHEFVKNIVILTKSDGKSLDVNKTAKQIAIDRDINCDDTIGEIALALVNAASQRGVAMYFHHDPN